MQASARILFRKTRQSPSSADTIWLTALNLNCRDAGWAAARHFEMCLCTARAVGVKAGATIAWPEQRMVR